MFLVHINNNEEWYDIEFKKKGMTYQMVISDLINQGYESGRIYDLDNNEVYYQDPVDLEEFIYEVVPGEISTVEIINLNGTTDERNFEITYPVQGQVRDIYNKVVAMGAGKNIKIAIQKEIERPERPSIFTPVEVGTDIMFPLKPHVRYSSFPKIGKLTKVETAVREYLDEKELQRLNRVVVSGKSLPLNIPISELYLAPGRVLYLVKTHIGFTGEGCKE